MNYVAMLLTRTRSAKRASPALGAIYSVTARFSLAKSVKSVAWVLVLMLGSPALAKSTALAERYAPILRFHPEEKYFPTDPLEFIRKSTLKEVRFWFGPIQTFSTISTDPALTLSLLSRGTQKQVLVHSEINPMSAPNPEAPLLWEWKAPWLTYWFHYDQSVVNDLPVFGLADHQGEWEGISLLIDEKDHVKLAFYSQHEGGEWFCPNELEWIGDTPSRSRPVVYSALGTHASFSRIGRFVRESLGYDLTAHGKESSSRPALRALRDEPYYGFQGHWGALGWFGFGSGPRVPLDGVKTLPRPRDLERYRRKYPTSAESHCTN